MQTAKTALDNSKRKSDSTTQQKHHASGLLCFFIDLMTFFPFLSRKSLSMLSHGYISSNFVGLPMSNIKAAP